MSNKIQISQKSSPSTMPINNIQQPPISTQQQQPGTLSNPAVVPQQQQTILKEDDKMPLFLIKLWNIVEDPSFWDIIRWDESGYSFHILDPYTFCQNVLPQYFKHNNLNSLIRQLNMYGFRKMTPIERTSLARLESDQDHLEFSHPCFVRDHPELLTQIKRKIPTTRRDDGVSAQPSKDLANVLEEVRVLRERQKTMEERMNELVTDNNAMWQQMTSMRAAHAKQQQIVNKLVQFLVTLVQPKRLSKRHMLAIDEFASPKRARTSEAPDNNGISSQSLQTIQQSNVNDILDHLMKEISKSNAEINLPSTQNGPIISDVTDELDHLSTTGTGQMSQGDFLNQRSNNSPSMGVYDPNAFGYQNQLQPHMIPVSQQQQHRPPSTQQQQQQAVPQVLSPNVMPDDPLVLSPNGELGFTSNDFADYLSGVDGSIESCRDLIGDHWNSFDFDNLLNSSDPSPPGAEHSFSQQQPLSLEQIHPQYHDSIYPSPTNISTAIPASQQQPQQSISSQQQHQSIKTPPQMAAFQQQPQILSSPNRSYGNRRKR
jgi:hypothetical protein